MVLLLGLLKLIAILAIVGVIIWGLNRILAVLPIAEPFRTVIYVIIVIVCVILCVYVILDLVGAATGPLLPIR